MEFGLTFTRFQTDTVIMCIAVLEMLIDSFVLGVEVDEIGDP
jgi:hypothetical protein